LVVTSDEEEALELFELDDAAKPIWGVIVGPDSSMGRFRVSAVG
jgi:hypothetical protein